MIIEPGDPDCDVHVAESFHEQTDDELTKKEAKHMEADDQAIQTILIGLPEDIYAAVDSCDTAQEIRLRVQQMMKANFVEVEKPTSNTTAHLSLVLVTYTFDASKANGKLLVNSILYGPYVRRMIVELAKQIEADDQAIQTIFIGLLEDIYAAVESCDTTQEIWLRVQQMMKGYDIGLQEKEAMNG
ncbi:hypothetical protein Tco_1022742 [Tanacetum coccineum]